MIKSSSYYNGSLYVGENYVEIKTDINYQMIQIKYYGYMGIYSSLPDNYVIRNGKSAILIIKKTNDNYTEKKLFRYKGYAKIVSCSVYDKNNDKHKIMINKSAIMTWDSMSVIKDAKSTGSSLIYKYDTLTRNWEDMIFDGNNNKKNYIYIKTIKEKESGNITTIKEIRSGVAERK